jgi:hypothetical protein
MQSYDYGDEEYQDHHLGPQESLPDQQSAYHQHQTEMVNDEGAVTEM